VRLTHLLKIFLTHQGMFSSATLGKTPILEKIPALLENFGTFLCEKTLYPGPTWP